MATDVGGVKGDVRLDVDRLKKAQVTVTKSFGDMQDAADRADRQMRDVGDTSDKTAGKASILGDVLAGELAAEGIMAVASGARDAVTAVGSMTAQISRQISESRRMSRTLGVSTQTVQELRHALTKMGVEGDAITEIFATISERQQAALDGSEDMAAQWEKLGISMADLRGANPAQILMQIERGMRQTDDPTRRLAAATELLGDEFGKKLVNRMARGEKAISDYRREARELGIVMSDAMVEDFGEAEDAMRRLETATAAFKRLLAAEAAPALAEIADAGADVVTIGTGIAQAWNEVEDSGLGWIVDAGVTSAFDAVSFGLFGDLRRDIPQTADAIREMQSETDNADEATTAWQQSLEGASGVINAVQRGTSEASSAIGSLTDQIGEFIEKGAKKIKGLREREIRGLRADIAELQAHKVGLDDALKIARTESRVQSLRARIKEMKADMAEAAGKVQRARQLRAEAQGLRAKGRQGRASAQARQAGAQAAQGLPGTARQVAGQAARAGTGSAVSAAMGARAKATGAARGQAGREAEIQQKAFTRNMDKAKRQWQQHSAAAKQDEQATQSLKKQRQSSIQQVQTLTGELGGLTTALADATGAGRQAQGAISGASGAIQSIIGGVATGGPLGLISGGIGAVTSLVSGMSVGGGPSQQARDTTSIRKQQHDFAKILSDQLEAVFKDALPDAQEINIDARGALVGTKEEVAKGLFELMDSELELRESAQGSLGR